MTKTKLKKLGVEIKDSGGWAMNCPLWVKFFNENCDEIGTFEGQLYNIHKETLNEASYMTVQVICGEDCGHLIVDPPVTLIKLTD
jgi:hypothetical protein